MENNFLLTDEMLWDYADGFLDEAEKLQVEAYLRQHPDQRQRLDTILADKRALSALPLSKPHAGFADRVMAAWVAEQTTALKPVKSRDWVVFSILGGFALFLLASFGLAIGSAPEAVSVIPEEYVPQVSMPDWAGMLDHTVLRYGLLLMLALLSLQILDKYLQQRIRLHHA